MKHCFGESGSLQPKTPWGAAWRYEDRAAIFHCLIERAASDATLETESDMRLQLEIPRLISGPIAIRFIKSYHVQK